MTAEGHARASFIFNYQTARASLENHRAKKSRRIVLAARAPEASSKNISPAREGRRSAARRKCVVSLLRATGEARRLAALHRGDLGRGDRASGTGRAPQRP
jgi:hypothetical protein